MSNHLASQLATSLRFYASTSSLGSLDHLGAWTIALTNLKLIESTYRRRHHHRLTPAIADVKGVTQPSTSPCYDNNLYDLDYFTSNNDKHDIPR
jgi:hypothetical protein